MLSAANSEVINLRVSPNLIDQLAAAAESEHSTHKVMIALAAAGYRVRPADVKDRTPSLRSAMA